jgi:hypothetical protein
LLWLADGHAGKAGGCPQWIRQPPYTPSRALFTAKDHAGSQPRDQSPSGFQYAYAGQRPCNRLRRPCLYRRHRAYPCCFRLRGRLPFGWPRLHRRSLAYGRDHTKTVAQPTLCSIACSFAIARRTVPANQRHVRRDPVVARLHRTTP